MFVHALQDIVTFKSRCESFGWGGVWMCVYKSIYTGIKNHNLLLIFISIIRFFNSTSYLIIQLTWNNQRIRNKFLYLNSRLIIVTSNLNNQLNAHPNTPQSINLLQKQVLHISHEKCSFRRTAAVDDWHNLHFWQVSCKIINVRSGDELPEKCRELAMHFETQGTPIMIGQ